MKQSIIIFFLSIFTFKNATEAQVSQFYANGVKSWTANNGRIFYPKSANIGAMVVNPKSDLEKPVSTVYNSAINITGNLNGQINGLFKLYDENFSNTFQGPIELENNVVAKFVKHWKVRHWEILELIDDYEDNNIIDKIPSLNILTWPGKENPYSGPIEGINWKGRDFAPYFDRNNDGVYDPMSGDYPIVDASCNAKVPTEMNWSLYHTYPIAGNIFPKLEIHTLLYGYESTKSVLLNSTIYTKISVVNFEDNFNDVKFGLFNDFDLGCPDDDFLGTSVPKNATYAYNYKDNDHSPCNVNGPKNTFQGLVPTQSIACLNRNLSGSMICFRQSFLDGMTDPSNLLQLNNLLNNKWKDGTPLQIGQSGYNIDNGITTNFAFPDTPNDPDGWHMDELSPGIDPRIFMNVDIGNMVKYDRATIDFAYTYHSADTSLTRLENVDKMIHNIDTIQQYYNECFESTTHSTLCSTECIWPGDADNNNIVNNLDILSIGAALGKSGPARVKMYDAFQPINSTNWNSNTPNDINYKYIDCNGSGLVTIEDLETVKNNLFYSNPEFTEWGGFNTLGEDLLFNKFFFTPEIIGGESFIVDLILGKHNPVNIYGMAYSVSYDTTFLDLDYTSITKDWLASPFDHYSIIGNTPGKLHVGYVKTNGQNSEYSNLKLGRLEFKVKENFNGPHETFLKFENYAKITSDENITELTSTPLLINVNNTLSTSKIEDNDIKLYPNPAHNEVNIDSKFEFNSACLIDCTGKRIQKQIRKNRLNLSNIPDGLYIIQLKESSGNNYYKKLIVLNN